MAPKEGPHAGKTVMWWLASTSEGCALLINNPKLLDKAALDAAPKEGSHAGKTVIWWLAQYPECSEILKQTSNPKDSAGLDVTLLDKNKSIKAVSVETSRNSYE